MCLCMCANDSFYVAYIASVPGIVFITLSVCFCSLQIVDIYCYSGVSYVRVKKFILVTQNKNFNSVTNVLI